MTQVLPVIIGVGNEFRSDDGVGRYVARAIADRVSGVARVTEQSGEGAALIAAWQGADRVYVVDAVQSGTAPGVIHRLCAHAAPLPTDLFRFSTHAVSVADAVELARVMGELPRELIVFGIEGVNFEAGTTLSPEVVIAGEEVSRRIESELCTNSR